MNVKITSGEIGAGTRVTGDNGQEIQGIVALKWSASVGDFNRAEIELAAVGLDAAGRAEFMMTDPATGETKRISRISFADGSSWVDEEAA